MTETTLHLTVAGKARVRGLQGELVDPKRGVHARWPLHPHWRRRVLEGSLECDRLEVDHGQGMAGTVRLKAAKTRQKG